MDGIEINHQAQFVGRLGRRAGPNLAVTVHVMPPLGHSASEPAGQALDFRCARPQAGHMCVVIGAIDRSFLHRLQQQAAEINVGKRLQLGARQVIEELQAEW